MLKIGFLIFGWLVIGWFSFFLFLGLGFLFRLVYGGRFKGEEYVGGLVGRGCFRMG